MTYSTQPEDVIAVWRVRHESERNRWDDGTEVTTLWDRIEDVRQSDLSTKALRPIDRAHLYLSAAGLLVLILSLWLRC